MVNRYGFYNVFFFDTATKALKPIVKVKINGVRFEMGLPIPYGPSFGGLNLYGYMGRDIAGIWDDQTKTLVILGFY